MGNLVRKKAQILINTIGTNTINAGSATVPLAIENYNQIGLTDKILKFKKSTTTAGTSQVTTVTPNIVYPDDAPGGAEFIVTLRGKENLGWANGPGRVTNFFLAGQTFAAHIFSLAAANAGKVADADYTLLLNQIRTQINSHPLWRNIVVATGTTTLILTVPANISARTTQFDVLISQEYGSANTGTAGVYPKLTLADIQRIFPIYPYMAGSDPSARLPLASVTAWNRYYFKILKSPAYSLDGANHVDSYIEEVEFYLPDGATNVDDAGATSWDVKILDYLTANGSGAGSTYVDPSGDTTPWGLINHA